MSAPAPTDASLVSDAAAALSSASIASPPAAASPDAADGAEELNPDGSKKKSKSQLKKEAKQAELAAKKAEAAAKRAETEKGSDAQRDAQKLEKAKSIVLVENKELPEAKRVRHTNTDN